MYYWTDIIATSEIRKPQLKVATRHCGLVVSVGWFDASLNESRTGLRCSTCDAAIGVVVPRRCACALRRYRLCALAALWDGRAEVRTVKRSGAVAARERWNGNRGGDYNEGGSNKTGLHDSLQYQLKKLSSMRRKRSIAWLLRCIDWDQVWYISRSFSMHLGPNYFFVTGE
jgi:hypothetical protein